MSSEVMNVAALGRPFTLGMLYDARRDELIPGLTLWDLNTLKEKTVETSQQTSNFKVSPSDSIESKSSLMDIEASLKVSFLCGLIEVGGSAKYLNDTKKFKNQSRVTCRYNATTHFNQLSVTQGETMSTQQKDVIKKTTATHVVTGILYGADVFFVFDSEKLEVSSVQDIQGHMEAVIKKIPSFNVEGQVDIKLTEEEKELTNKFSCKFYGDFILQSNPATFIDAVKTYVELPKLLGEDGEKSVPVKVWMMPLKVFDTTAAELMKEISVGLVWKAQNVLEDLREIQMRCNDSLHDTVVQKLPQIQEELNKFQNCCNRYVSNLQTNMAKKLPSIREGKDDERSVKKLLDDRNKSPFSHEKLDKWLDHKEREINIIRSCVEMMEGTKIVHNQSELDREVLAAGVNEALCFIFTSLQSADPILDEMDQYLDSPSGSTIEDLDSLRGSTNEVPWYYSDEVLTKMREKAKYFQDIAKSLKSNSRRDLLRSSDELRPREHKSSFEFLPPTMSEVSSSVGNFKLGTTDFNTEEEPDGCLRAQNALEGLREIQMRCNDSLNDTVVENLPQIQKKLSKFQNCCNHYVSNLQTTMAKKPLSIREGTEDESSVEKLLDDRNKSPFSHEKLDEWLDHKEREINVIRSCVEMMEGTKIVRNQSELDREVLAAGVDEALCFVFTSLQSADPGLDEMDQYLDSLRGSTKEVLDSFKGSTNEVPWYYSDEVLTKMRKKAKYFQDTAKSLKSNSRVCFLVAAITNEKHTGATIYHYRNGILLTEDFSKPDIPDVETVTDRRDLLWPSDELQPRERRSSFRFLPPDCFLVAAITNEKHPGATIYHYRNGILLTEDFSKPNIPDVETVTDRRDLLRHACDLTLDPDTASYSLTLSDRNKKATHGPKQSYPERSQRFDYFAQVLCREELTGRCYWEVEWESSKVNGTAGVCYRGMERKGNRVQSILGRNKLSWCLGYVQIPGPEVLSAEHDNQKDYLPVPSPFTHLGVYLDWSAGTLSYYNVSSDTLSHIYTFHTKFTEPVYPGFGIWDGSSASLCL